MIDIESEVFSAIRQTILDVYPSADIKSRTILNPAQFPCVCIEEKDNYTYVNGIDSSFKENFVNVVYEIRIYTNKADTMKSQAKKILNLADEKFTELGFTRRNINPISLDDATKYCLLVRYDGVVSASKTIYGR